MSQNLIKSLLVLRYFRESTFAEEYSVVTLNFVVLYICDSLLNGRGTSFTARNDVRKAA